MNLSDKVFSGLESEKEKMEKSIGFPISWDAFFVRVLTSLGLSWWDSVLTPKGQAKSR